MRLGASQKTYKSNLTTIESIHTIFFDKASLHAHTISFFKTSEFDILWHEKREISSNVADKASWKLPVEITQNYRQIYIINMYIEFLTSPLVWTMNLVYIQRHTGSLATAIESFRAARSWAHLKEQRLQIIASKCVAGAIARAEARLSMPILSIPRWSTGKSSL